MNDKLASEWRRYCHKWLEGTTAELGALAPSDVSDIQSKVWPIADVQLRKLMEYLHVAYDAIQAGRGYAALAPLRSVYESAIWLQWILLDPGPWEAGVFGDNKIFTRSRAAAALDRVTKHLDLPASRQDVVATPEQVETRLKAWEFYGLSQRKKLLTDLVAFKPEVKPQLSDIKALIQKHYPNGTEIKFYEICQQVNEHAYALYRELCYY